jgi:hypothetical protein
MQALNTGMFYGLKLLLVNDLRRSKPGWHAREYGTPADNNCYQPITQALLFSRVLEKAIMQSERIPQKVLLP